MVVRRVTIGALAHQTARSTTPYSTTSFLRQQYQSKVETPLQAQHKDSTAHTTPIQPPAEAQTLETPLQKQRREALAPATDPKTRDKSWAIPNLLAGLVAIPPVVYYYYQYRREHMDNKRAMLMEQQRQKYASGG